MRLLHLPRDERAMQILSGYNLRKRADLKAAAEAVETHGLAPHGWAEHVHIQALPIALRNPNAIITAECLLREVIVAEITRAVAAGSAHVEELRCAYGGTVVYQDAQNSANAISGLTAASLVPDGLCGKRNGWICSTSDVKIRFPKEYASDVRRWRLDWPRAFAHAAHIGAEWQREICKLGLATVFMRRRNRELGIYQNRWFLIVRDGEGWELPMLVTK